MRLVLLGPPGAGKGTQAQRICAAHGLVHVSTGDLLREAVSQGTDLGVEVKGYLDRGALAPDALVISILEERISRPDASGGYLLDGFPRNTAQAESLEARLGTEGIDAVVHMRLMDEEIVGRLLARGRADDSESVIRNRLEVYARQTAPLIKYYGERSLLTTVDALGTMDQVFERISDVLNNSANTSANTSANNSASGAGSTH